MRRLLAAILLLLAGCLTAAAQNPLVLPHLDLRPAEQGAGGGAAEPAGPAQTPAAAKPAELKLFNLNISAAGPAAAGRTGPGAAPLNITVMSDRKPDFSLFFLASPPRLVVNLPAAQFSFTENSVNKSGNLRSLRYGPAGAGRARLVFGLKQPYRLAYSGAEPLIKNNPQSAWQLILRLAPAGAAEFRRMIAGQKIPAAPIAAAAENTAGPAGSLPPAAISAAKPFIVMIDPGHGDFDSGAIGVGGIEEKQLTLAFSEKLYRILQAKPGIQPYLTRDRDEFLRLSARTEKARQKNADLFISIHADHINMPDLHGATIYTLSDKASDKMAGSLAEYENKSDLLDGLPADEPPAVADILLDMTRRETRRFSEDFARRAIAALRRGGVALINNPQRSAGFQVLRAAEIPSALIELGYLSNAGDARRIADPAWQEKTANILAAAIADYAHAHKKNKKPH